MKTKILASLLVLGLLSPSVFAGDEYYNEPEYQTLSEYDFDLDIEVDGKRVELEWNELNIDEELKWWKFVFSKSDSTPLYPENDSKYLGDDPEMTEKAVWLDAGTYYVRLCAITHEMGRYCSEVEKIEVATQEKDYKKEYEYKKYEKDEYKKDYYEKKEEVKDYKKDYTKTNYSNLSEELKEKIEDVVDRFIDRLEDKGLDDDEMMETLDAVIDRLSELKSQPKYKALVTYMIALLEEEKQEYDNSFSELEDILDDF